MNKFSDFSPLVNFPIPFIRRRWKDYRRMIEDVGIKFLAIFAISPRLTRSILFSHHGRKVRCTSNLGYTESRRHSCIPWITMIAQSATSRAWIKFSKVSFKSTPPTDLVAMLNRPNSAWAFPASHSEKSFEISVGAWRIPLLIVRARAVKMTRWFEGLFADDISRNTKWK